MTYKVIPAAMVISGSQTDVSNYFQNIINQQAAQGWQFYSMETATAEENPGCSLLGAAPQRTNMNLLIFCKAEPGETFVAPGTHSGVPAPATPSAPTTPSAPKTPTPNAPSKPFQRPTPPVGEMWVCSSCGTSNKAAYGMCKKCGTYRSST